MADDPTTLVRLLQLSDAEIAAAFRAEAIAELRAWLDAFTPPAVPPAPPTAPDVPRTHFSMDMEPDQPKSETLPDIITGAMIRAYRLSRFPILSQAELAKRVGCGNGLISEIENGIKAPSLALQDKLRAVMATHVEGA